MNAFLIKLNHPVQKGITTESTYSKIWNIYFFKEIGYRWMIGWNPFILQYSKCMLFLNRNAYVPFNLFKF